MHSPRIDFALTTMLESHGLHRRKAGRGFDASHDRWYLTNCGPLYKRPSKPGANERNHLNFNEGFSGCSHQFGRKSPK